MIKTKRALELEQVNLPCSLSTAHNIPVQRIEFNKSNKHKNKTKVSKSLIGATYQTNSLHNKMR